MNRIILIGNGFDLAHGLKTSYRDFIDDYWKTFKESVEKKRMTCLDDVYEDKHTCIKMKIVDTPTYENPYENQKDLVEIKCPFYGYINGEIIFTNQFLKHIYRYVTDKNWVDIENEYYELMKKCTHDEAVKLNKEFKIIEELLEIYLTKILETPINKKDSINKKIHSIFEAKDISESTNDFFISALILRIRYLFYSNKHTFFPDSTRSYIEKKMKLSSFIDAENDNYSEYAKNKIKDDLAKNIVPEQILMPNDILFLNFNYTDTSGKYILDKSKFETIHIHGELNNPKNPIIFGYGDELAEDYKQIEERKDDVFLENVKSIRYLETDNYRRLLSFIESDTYQVLIMGHSCGVSDRTLLNTLFEHKNCVSIKPYYHLRKDSTDNYNEIIRNISRNFTNKAVMRERVVNKTYCEPLT